MVSTSLFLYSREMQNPEEKEIFLSGGNASIDRDSLVLEAKIQEGLEFLLKPLYRRIGAAAARAEGLEASQEEQDQVCSEFLSQRGLMEEAEVDAWLKWMGIEEASLDAYFEELALVEKLKEKVVPQKDVEKRFRESQYDYAKVEAGMVNLESSGMASEVLLSLREKETSWEKVLSQFGGKPSLVMQRRNAPEEAASLLFSAEMQEYVGPIETEEGAFRIYRVLSRETPKLDEDLQAEIRQELYQAHLERLMAKDPIRFTSNS